MARDDDNLFEDDSPDDEDAFYDPFDDDIDDVCVGPAPHPDDRLWRHPSELASLGAPRPSDSAAFAATTLRGADPLSRSVPWRRARPLVATAATVAIIAFGMTRFNNVEAPTTQNVSAFPDSLSVETARRGTQLKAAIAEQPDQIQQAGAAWKTSFHAQVSPSVPTVIALTDAGVTKQQGIIFDNDGHVVTSARGLVDAKTIRVIDEFGHEATGIVVGSDAISDLAVLATNGALAGKPRTLVESAPHVGDPILIMGQVDRDQAAIGRVQATRQRLDSSATASFFNAIHIDASGESALPGAPAFNDTGAVIGIVSGALSDPTTNSEPGVFAVIPARTISAVTEAIIESGTAIWPWIGVELEIVNDPNAATVGANNLVSVAVVHPDSPASQAGLQVGDRITAIAGKPVTSPEMIGRTIQSSPVGTHMVVDVDRDGTPVDVVVTLTGRSDTTVAVTPVPTP